MQPDQDLKCLDELIADLGGSSDAGRQSGDSCDLLLEHLQAARRDLLGLMLDEYRLNLQQAKESLTCIADRSARAKTKERLLSLIESEMPKHGAFLKRT
jgi:hypothetical protein